MKKLLMVFLAALLLVSVTACGKKDDYLETEDFQEFEDFEDATVSNTDVEEAEEQRLAMDRYLSSVEDMIQSDPDRASDMLKDLPEGEITADQKQWIAELKTAIAQRKAELQNTSDEEDVSEDTSLSDQATDTEAPVLSPEKAAEYLKKAYPQVEGDVGDALLPQYNENGELYYSIVMQIAEGEIKTVHILPDGTVRVAD